jgi:hypothetical protein
MIQNAISSCPDVSESDISKVLEYAAMLSIPDDKLIAHALKVKCGDDAMVQALSLLNSKCVLGLLGWIERVIGSEVSPLHTWFLSKSMSRIEKVLTVKFNK